MQFKKCISDIKIYQNHMRLSFSMISIGFYSDLIDTCKIKIRYMNVIFREFLRIKSRRSLLSIYYGVSIPYKQQVSDQVSFKVFKFNEFLLFIIQIYLYQRFNYQISNLYGRIQKNISLVFLALHTVTGHPIFHQFSFLLR